MGLRDIIINRTAITLPDGQTFSVRGLAAMDLMALVHTHGAAMALAFAKIRAGAADKTVTEELVRKMLTSVGSDLPEVMAAVIALASDSYDDQGIKIAGQLPFMSQVSALVEVFKLSFASETEIKKLMDSLVSGMATVAASLKEATIPSLDGMLASVAASASV